MKNPKVRLALISAAWLVSIMLAFVVGLSVGQRQMRSVYGNDLDNMQVDLLYHRIQDDNHLEMLLSKKCMKPLSQFIEGTTDEDMSTLKSFLADHKNMDDTETDIRNNDPGFLEQVKSYTPKFPVSWVVDPCN